MSSTENIEYKKGWQIERNKDNPKALHQLFSNDKIIHGMDASLNIGMAETMEQEKEFECILNEAQEKMLTESLEKMKEAVMDRTEIRETFKRFLFSLNNYADDETEFTNVDVPKEVVQAIQSVLLGGWK